MTDEQKRWLVENSAGAMLEGVPCSVAGWKNDRVLAGDKNFRAEDVSLSSWAWLGVGVEVPDRLKGWLARI